MRSGKRQPVETRAANGVRGGQEILGAEMTDICVIRTTGSVEYVSPFLLSLGSLTHSLFPTFTCKCGLAVFDCAHLDTSGLC